MQIVAMQQADSVAGNGIIACSGRSLMRLPGVDDERLSTPPAVPATVLHRVSRRPPHLLAMRAPRTDKRGPWLVASHHAARAGINGGHRAGAVIAV
jgi:hypothetical protein